MLSRLRNMFRVPDLRNKILFTLVIVAIYRVGAHIPVPYVDFSAIQSGNIKPALSALIGVDSGDTCTFQVRLGGTPGLATDGQPLVSITAQAQGPAPTIATGASVAAPTQPTLVKITGFTGKAGSTARIAGLRATFTG